MTVPPDVYAAVAADIRDGLSKYFTLGSVRFLSPTAETDRPLSNGTAAAVAWEIDCVDDLEFPDLDPSLQSFVAEGVTIVSASNGTTMFQRYVDWNRIIGQLGESSHRRSTAEPTVFRRRRQRTLAQDPGTL